MANNFFRFQQFTVYQQQSSMKVTTDACLFGAWTARLLRDLNGTLLDIGTGTGLLALMVAQQFAGNITAIEIDADAVAEAASNFRASPWPQRLSAKHTPLQQFDSSNQFDVIISNPPFFVNDLRSPDQRRNTALHGEQLSIKDLFGYTLPLLADHGLFALLVSARRTAEVETLAKEYCLAAINRALVHQTPAHDAFRAMYLFSKSAASIQQSDEQIIIRDEDGNYSSRFVELLNDYYLNLKKPSA